MMGRTISFPKGGGSLTHNNREFIANNVCAERTGWNKTYIMESIAEPMRDASVRLSGNIMQGRNETTEKSAVI